jgi:hypothetical protein
MTQHFNLLKFILISFLIVGCGKAIPDMDDIDLNIWKNDHNGCLGERASMIDSFREQKQKLLGLSEMEIISLLGKPDQNELYDRNQKFYHYYFEPSSSCGKPNSNPHKLSIRFNAMGLAKEVAVE